MKLLVFFSCILFVGFVVNALPHQGEHKHSEHKHSDHKHSDHKHSDHTHTLNATHQAGKDHYETMAQHEDHMNKCHQETKPVDCTEMLKTRWAFKHTANTTHHQCVPLENNKCSTSLNAFETEEQCEKACHHDDHEMSSKQSVV